MEHLTDGSEHRDMQIMSQSIDRSVVRCVIIESQLSAKQMFAGGCEVFWSIEGGVYHINITVAGLAGATSSAWVGE